MPKRRHGGADTNDARAMGPLGALLSERGEVTAAETCWRRAADTGDARAMVDLGGLLHRRGDDSEAEAWWRRAAATGYAYAMGLLVVLLREHGEGIEADSWHRRFVDTADAHVVGKFEHLLGGAGRRYLTRMFRMITGRSAPRRSCDSRVAIRSRITSEEEWFLSVAVGMCRGGDQLRGRVFRTSIKLFGRWLTRGPVGADRQVVSASRRSQ
jgi:hypothetical protein